MEVNELVIALRQRSHWSAIDLGMLLARRWWRSLLLSWLVPALTVYLLLALLLQDHPQLVILIVWWLKPLFERFPLYIVSRRLFGEQTHALDALRAYREVCRPDLLPWQLWRRLNPLRSFVMPVTLLEKLQGKRREKRLGVLQMEASGPATWLTVIGAHIEGLFPLFYLGLISLLLPPELLDIDLLSGVLEQQAGVLWLASTLTFITMALVAPFYVTCGFMLYINRRVSLEGWDLELGFRQLVKRVGPSLRGAALTLFLGVCATSFIALPGQALAESPRLLSPQESTVEPAPLAPQQLDLLGTQATNEAVSADALRARETIDSVMASEAFNEVLQTYSWRWKFDDEDGDSEQDSEIPQWVISLVEFIESIYPDWDIDATEVMAWLLRAVIITALLLFVLYIAVRYRQTIADWMRDNAPPPQDAEAPPDILFGLAVKRDSLPSDVPAEVRALWQRGERRPAVALLYRATLSVLIHKYDFRFTEDLTENECARLVQSRGEPALSAYFSDLSNSWQALAYGHREPGDVWLSDACEQWRKVFDDE